MSTDNQHTEFTDEEIANQAKGNVVGMLLALIVHGREHGETAESVTRWAGKLFAPGWTELQNQGAYHAARTVALNLASQGATVQHLAGDERRAEVTVVWVPDQEMLSVLGVHRDETDAIFMIFEPIAASLGLQYQWQRQGETVTMVMEQGTT